ncbi:MAG: FAD-dependent monooxygenase, partial [Pseudonocardia sp.]|nr:FAD-dependent monooxygenase [Pseudonocardia sp.]
TVLEQGDARGERGVGLNLLPHAVRMLADLDLLDAITGIGVRTATLTYAHRLGMPIVRRPCGLAAGFDLPQVSCHRGRFHRLLLDTVRDRLGSDAVRTGARVTGVDTAGAVTLSHRETVHADVVIGADGIHSAVRAALVPGEGPPRWNGVSMWRGAVDWPAFDGGAAMIVAGGTAAKLVVYPIGPGARPGTVLTNWAICILTGRGGDPPPHQQDWSRPGDPAVVAAHARRFRLADVDHHALVAATPVAYEFPMCDRDPMRRWTHGRVSLLGDAAHPMYPMGSNGAGQAILDAESLARHLAAASASGADPGAALTAYEAERLPVTADVVRRNRAGGPEGVIDEVERRAPDGFDRLADVMPDAERDAILSSYAAATGATPEQVRRV